MPLKLQVHVRNAERAGIAYRYATLVSFGELTIHLGGWNMVSGNIGTIITVVVVIAAVFFLLREALHIAFMVVGAVLVLAVLSHYMPGLSSQMFGWVGGALDDARLWVSQYLHAVSA